RALAKPGTGFTAHQSKKQMVMMDPREDAVLALALSPAWIRPYSGFIFVCGGPVDVREHVPLSVRDALLRRAASKPSISNRIRLAEEFKEWSVDGHYRD